MRDLASSTRLLYADMNAGHPHSELWMAFHFFDILVSNMIESDIKSKVIIRIPKINPGIRGFLGY